MEIRWEFKQNILKAALTTVDSKQMKNEGWSSNGAMDSEGISEVASTGTSYKGSARSSLAPPSPALLLYARFCCSQQLVAVDTNLSNSLKYMKKQISCTSNEECWIHVLSENAPIPYAHLPLKWCQQDLDYKEQLLFFLMSVTLVSYTCKLHFSYSLAGSISFVPLEGGPCIFEPDTFFWPNWGPWPRWTQIHCCHWNDGLCYSRCECNTLPRKISAEL